MTPGGQVIDNPLSGERITRARPKTHAARAMMKLGARDRAQLVVTACEAGLVRSG